MEKEKITETVPQRNYKDRLFRMIFREKKDLLSLYNAVNGTNYTDEKAIEIVTLENAIYMSMKNDLAFLMDFELNLYEHQSTFSPNMPLRDLFYISKELQKLVETDLLYRTSLVEIPTPRFLVLYNGTSRQPERQILKLSEAFQKKTEEPELELKVTMLNINLGHNNELMEQCKKLREYAVYVDRMRKYAKIMPIEEAAERTVTECIKEDVLKEFLTKYRREAIMSSIFEYNEEKAMQYIREDEYSRGVKSGVAEGKAEERAFGIKTLILDNLEEKIEKERIIEKLVKHYALSEEEAKEQMEQVLSERREEAR